MKFLNFLVDSLSIWLAFIFLHLFTLFFADSQRINSKNYDSVIDVIWMIRIDNLILVWFFIQVFLNCSLVQTIFPIFSYHKRQDHSLLSYKGKLVFKIIHTATLTHNRKIVIFNQMEKTSLFCLIWGRRRNSLRFKWLFTVSDTIEFSPFLVKKIPRSDEKLGFSFKHLPVDFNVSLNQIFNSRCITKTDFGS